MSGYRPQRPDASGRAGPSDGNDGHYRAARRDTNAPLRQPLRTGAAPLPSYRDERRVQQPFSHPSQQSLSSSYGSSYKPSRYNPLATVSSLNRGDRFWEREREKRDAQRYTRRDDRRVGYGDSFRDRYVPRGDVRRDTYSGYRDRAERESSTWHDKYNRWQPDRTKPRVPFNRADLSRTSEPDLLDYDSTDILKKERPSLSQQQPSSSQSFNHTPPKSRPSLIPTDFKDTENEEEDEDMSLEKAMEASVPKPAPTETKTEEPSKTAAADKPEGSTKTSDQSKETHPSTEQPVKPIETSKSTLPKLIINSEVKPQVLQVESTQHDDEEDEEDPSDNYDPEDVMDVDEPTQIAKGASATTKLEDPTPKLPVELPSSKGVSSLAGSEAGAPEMNLATPSPEPTIPPPLESSQVTPLQSPEGCIFPLNRVEQRVWELKNHSRDEVLKRLPYLLRQPVKDLREYPFYDRNLLVHKQGVKPKLLQSLSVMKTEIFSHKINLLNEYANRENEWHSRCEKMNKQLKDLYPQEEGAETVSKTDTATPTSAQERNSRRSRHGDTVRSEAEFLEILENLEKEKEKDPMYLAERLAADIPDMILDPVKKSAVFANTNNLVQDKKAWASRIKTDAKDTFTDAEHSRFCEAFLAHPKKFGRIASLMGGGRTSLECVLHYYTTKKTKTDYKQLLLLKKGKKGKGKGRGKRGKKSSTNTPTAETPGENGEEQLNLGDFIPKEPEEELYTETGRRRRAAAPVFDKEEERKRSLDGGESSDKGKKKTRGSKRGAESTLPTPDVEFHAHETDGGKKLISSYWSVKDVNTFVELLKQLGPKWSEIATLLGTKSPTMVRNYYQRNADSQGWREFAENPDRIGNPSTSAVHTEVPQQDDQQGLKRPPLGFFSTPVNVPTNVGVHNHLVAHQQQPAVMEFPPLANFTPKPERLPQMHLVQRTGDPSLEYRPSLPWSQPPQPQQQAPEPPRYRADPFSIRSLLNPDEKRPAPPTLPVAGSFSPVSDKKEFYSEKFTPANGNGGVTESPLDALLAAADHEKRLPVNTPPQPPQPLQPPASNGPSFLGSLLNPTQSPRKPSVNSLLNSDDQ